MSKAYKSYDEVDSYGNGWGNSAYSGTDYSDHVCRPVVVDAEGRKNPIIRCTYGHNTQGYVMKAEVVERISHAADPVVSFVTDYRHSSDDHLADYKGYRLLGSAYDHPEKVEKFLTKVQNDDSSPVSKVSAGPFNSNWRARPTPIGKSQGIGVTKYDDDSDERTESYPQIHKGTNPISNNKDMYYEKSRGGNEGPVAHYYEKPRGGNEGPVAHSHQLSKPTNDIGRAVEFPTDAIKPNYRTNTQPDISRPVKAGPLSSIHWRTGSNLAPQNRKMDSREDDWEKPKEQPMSGKDKIDYPMQVARHDVIIPPGHYILEPANPINNKEGNEKANGHGSAMYFGKPAPFPASSQQPRFTVPAMQTKETYPSPETIDSSEARKRYGKLKNQPVPEGLYKGTIDSNDAVKKYNGAKVPW